MASEPPGPAPGLGRPLEVGDWGPPVILRDRNGKTVSSRADSITGRPTVVMFPAATETAVAVEACRRRAAALADAGVSVLIAARAADGAAPDGGSFRFLVDSEGEARAAHGLPRHAPANATLLLDANHRVVLWLDGGDAEQQLDRTLEHLHECPAEDAHAPVIIVPRALAREDCRRLIEVWQRPVRIWDTDGLYNQGFGQEPGDFKVRNRGYAACVQYVLRDAEICRWLDPKLMSRVLPSIAKAFGTQPSRREDYRIACYDAAEGGRLGAHRDNPSDETRHRRFTVSVNLNTEDYDGGELAFPEYGRRLYKVPTGAALIWSCSLLHEVMPVTRGRRFMLGSHLFGT